MTHLVARFGMKLLLCSVAMAAQAEQTPQSSADSPPPAAIDAPATIIQQGSWNEFRAVDPSSVSGDSASGEQRATLRPRSLFVTSSGASEFAQRTKERLADPEQRVALRAEQRAAVVAQNAGVGRIVGLDSAAEQKLIELLTDQQMESLEQTLARPRTAVPDLQEPADQITQRLNALRDLLGDEKLERFQEFESGRTGRHWVSQLGARLAPADQLQPDQEDRLTALKQEQFQIPSASRQSSRVINLSFGQPHDSRRHARIVNENSWRKRQVEIPALEQKAAAFLTAAQLAELSKLHAQEHDSLRRSVEAMRAEAGLDPKIPEQPEQMEETPKPIEAQLQVEVSLTVNREPTRVTSIVRSGESFTFEAAQGLIVEATPTMYDDDRIDVYLNYYEDGTKGRRRLPGSSSSISQARQSGGSPATGGSTGTVVTGRKGYAVQMTVNAKAMTLR